LPPSAAPSAASETAEQRVGEYRGEARERADAERHQSAAHQRVFPVRRQFDVELAALAAANSWATVLPLPLTHLAPAWDALEEVAGHIETFLEQT
jgi:hypothetical protein